MKRFLAMLLCATMLVSCSDEVVSVFGNIYGTITDSKTGEPVRNAEVIISPGNKTIVSGMDGHFEFRDLEAEQYKVSVEADGYEYNSRQVTVVPGKDVTCDFRLKPIEIIQNLTVSPTTLNFGTSQTEMSVTITNKGTEETEWTVEMGNNSWLSASPKMGRIDAGKSQTIVFCVKRELLTEEKSIVVNIAAFGNTYPISVSCAPKQTHGELSVEPTSLDFGENATELSLKIKNIGDDVLNWTISDITVPCLSVSETSGKLDIGDYNFVKVKLDREKLTEDLSTTFIVSDGSNSKSITVTAKKKILKGELSVSSTSLDFGENTTELNLNIKNIGDGELHWTISDMTAPCLSVSETSGKLDAGGNKIVKVKLDREQLAEDLNTTFIVSDGTKEVSVMVKARKKILKGELSVESSYLDFGEDATELNLKIKNVGNDVLNWTISDITAPCLSVSETSGKLDVGGNKIVKVKLDREKLTEDLTTTFIVSDGTKEMSITIKAKKKIIKGELWVETSLLDFGDDLSEKTITIHNIGTAPLKWTISNVTAPFSVSATEGELAEGTSKMIQVKLDRESMTEDLSTLFIISDGMQDVEVRVYADYKSDSDFGDDETKRLIGTWVGYDSTDKYTLTFHSSNKATEKLTYSEGTFSMSGRYKYSDGKITEWNMEGGSVLINTLGECPWTVTFISSTKITIGDDSYSITFTKQ